MKLLGILSAAISTACTSVRVLPACSAENEWGIARAATPDLAEQLSASILSVAPKVAATLPGMEQKRLDVCLVSRVSSGHSFEAAGACHETPPNAWIEIGIGEPEGRDATLAHELVHLWLGPAWEPLPPAMEDGLANLVTSSLFPEKMIRMRLYYVIAMSTVMSGAFEIDSYGAAAARRSVPFTLSVRTGKRRADIQRVREGLSLTADTYERVDDEIYFFELVSFSYLLASRIGIEPLHQLCVRAGMEGLKQVPADWILEAAGLSKADPAAWQDAILELYGPAEKESLLRQPPWLEARKPGVPALSS